MKTIFIFLLITVMAISCHSQSEEKEFTLSGTIKNVVPGKLILTDSDSATIVFATSQLAEEGSFSMRVPATKEEQVYQLQLKYTEEGINFDLPLLTLVNRFDDIHIILDGNDILHPKIEGSNNSRKLNDFLGKYIMLANDFNKAIHAAMYVNSKKNTGTTASEADQLAIDTRTKIYALTADFIKDSGSEASVVTVLYTATRHLEPEAQKQLTELALEKFTRSKPIKEFQEHLAKNP